MEAIEYEAMHTQEQRLWWYRALHEIIIARLRSLSLPNQFQLLDAGCGTGGLLGKIQQTFPQASLFGLEYHPEGIRRLKQLQQISVIRGDINVLPLRSSSFDVITLTDVLYHLKIDPRLCLEECFRILKPGGHLLVNVAAYQWMLSTHDRQVHTRERYTARYLRQQLQDSGFIVQHSGYWNSFLFLPMLLHRLTIGKLKDHSDVERLPDWLEKIFYRILHSEQTLQQHQLHIPFGGSAWAWATKP